MVPALHVVNAGFQFGLHTLIASHPPRTCRVWVLIAMSAVSHISLKPSHLLVCTG